MSTEEIINLLKTDIGDLTRQKKELQEQANKIDWTIEHIEYLIKCLQGTAQYDRNNKKNSD